MTRSPALAGHQLLARHQLLDVPRLGCHLESAGHQLLARHQLLDAPRLDQPSGRHLERAAAMSAAAAERGSPSGRSGRLDEGDGRPEQSAAARAAHAYLRRWRSKRLARPQVAASRFAWVGSGVFLSAELCSELPVFSASVSPAHPLCSNPPPVPPTPLLVPTVHPPLSYQLLVDGWSRPVG